MDIFMNIAFWYFLGGVTCGVLLAAAVYEQIYKQAKADMREKRAKREQAAMKAAIKRRETAMKKASARSNKQAAKGQEETRNLRAAIVQENESASALAKAVQLETDHSGPLNGESKWVS